jgi:hypothetical protein
MHTGTFTIDINSSTTENSSGRSTPHAPLVFLGAYLVGLVYLVNTAHAGGRLVHEFGVHAMIPGDNHTSPSQSAEAPPKSGEGE